jgi:hypothetical protein
MLRNRAAFAVGALVAALAVITPTHQTQTRLAQRSRSQRLRMAMSGGLRLRHCTGRSAR